MAFTVNTLACSCTLPLIVEIEFTVALFIPTLETDTAETEEVDAEVKAEIAAEFFTFTETLEEQLVADETAREEDELPSTELDVLVVPETARVFLTATAIFEVEDAV